jgi:chemotaxis protein methyltransferase CheR
LIYDYNFPNTQTLQHSIALILAHAISKFISLNNSYAQLKFKAMDDNQFQQLLDYYNFSWSGYRKVRKGVKRRISRHMQELECPNTGAYLDLLEKSDALRRECARRMTVSISRFFRDRKLWLDLEQEILPALIATHKKTIRIWSAGCARGEEVYCVAIIWDRLREKYAHQAQLAITATDVNPDAIDKARTAVYTKSSLKEIPLEIQERYFDLQTSRNRFDLKSFIKKGIDWKVQDILENAPGAVFDIIFLRNNLLTYYQDHLKNKGLDIVVGALAPGGWLIVGSHEKLPAERSDLQRHKSIPWAYRLKI